MACDSLCKPKCPDCRKAWYEKMQAAKKLKSQTKLKVEKKVKKPDLLPIKRLRKE